MSFVRGLRVGSLLPLSFALLSACGGDDDDERQVMPSEGERTGAAGCYIPTEFRCDCELDQAACTDDVGMWVEMGCGSCAS